MFKMLLSSFIEAAKISPFASFREGNKVHVTRWDALPSLSLDSGAKSRFARITCCTDGKRRQDPKWIWWRDRERGQQWATWLERWERGQEQGKQFIQETDCNRKQWNGLSFYHLSHTGSQGSPARHQRAHPRHDNILVQCMWVAESLLQKGEKPLP